jgi:hypothetical protein
MIGSPMMKTASVSESVTQTIQTVKARMLVNRPAVR